MYKLCWTPFLLLLATACTLHAPQQIKPEPPEPAAAELCADLLADTRAYYERQQQQVAYSLHSLQQSLELQRQMFEAYREDTEAMRQEFMCRPAEPVESADQQRPDNLQGIYQNKLVVGEIEDILLPEANIILSARIDTGATTSSLDARNIEEFERNGESWVRFTLVSPQSGEETVLERRRVRVVRIVQSSLEEDTDRRPVVALRMTVGTLTQTSEFTLSDRSHMQFPILIGRNVLRDVMLVDVSGTNLVPVTSPLAEEAEDATVSAQEEAALDGSADSEAAADAEEGASNGESADEEDDTVPETMDNEASSE